MGRDDERWQVLNRKLRVADLPDPATEWMFYQTLVGAWPISPERAVEFLEKAVREAKVHTSWDQPSPIYEGAVNHFAHGVMRSRRFISELEEFVDIVRRPGTFQFPGPQIADPYRSRRARTCTRAANCGTWRLVDPDNRRPVDYETREALLGEVAAADLPSIWAGGDERGLTKLALVRRALNLRARHPSRSVRGGAARTSRCLPAGRRPTTSWRSAGAATW